MWQDKRRRGSFFSEDPFGGFDDISKMMNEMMKQAFQGSLSFKPVKTGKQAVYGFSMRVGADGQPVIEEFGNVEPRQKKIKQEREPLVDVLDKKEEVTAIVELPGVEKHEIDLKVSEDGRTLTINVPKKFYKELSLPSAVKTEAQAHYKNGVLEVNLNKIHASEPKKKKIQVA